MEKFYKALKPKGILILDFPIKGDEGEFVRDHGDYLEIMQVKREGHKYALHSSLYKKNKDLKFVKSLDVTATIYPPKELKKMLEETGFKVLFAFANKGIKDVKNRTDHYDLADFVEQRIRRLVWVCYKSE